MATTAKVGNVTIKYFAQKDGRQYSDGEVEDDLLEFFKSGGGPQERLKLMDKGWGYAYHLSPLRSNLLRWYNFKPGSMVLEIGAGCGAITECLVAKNINLTALELSRQRALINAYRNQEAQNLAVAVGNFGDFKAAEVFDYVVCVGVLEYAGGFIDSKEPYLDFVKTMRRHTKPGGKLLLAIENRLGLKYFAGSKEDHADNSYFDGINGYPRQDWVKTFGRRELIGLLSAGGYRNSYFYYPYPDYKMPLAVFSDDYLPGKNCDFPLNLLPASAPDKARRHLFSEQSAMISLERNGLVAEMANSFMVEAQ